MLYSHQKWQGVYMVSSVHLKDTFRDFLHKCDCVTSFQPVYCPPFCGRLHNAANEKWCFVNFRFRNNLMLFHGFVTHHCLYNYFPFVNIPDFKWALCCLKCISLVFNRFVHNRLFNDINVLFTCWVNKEICLIISSFLLPENYFFLLFELFY